MYSNSLFHLDNSQSPSWSPPSTKFPFWPHLLLIPLFSPLQPHWLPGWTSNTQVYLTLGLGFYCSLCLEYSFPNTSLAHSLPLWINFYCCHDESPQQSSFKQHSFILFQFCRSEVWVQCGSGRSSAWSLIRPKSRCEQESIPFWSSGKNLFQVVGWIQFLLAIGLRPQFLAG